MNPLKAIAAMSLNRVIGRGNQIPWHLPEDFRWFKQITMGGTLVMGRKTFESIGRPLPGRRTVVLSRAGFVHPGVTTIPGLEALDRPLLPAPIFICGGAQIYAQALPECVELYLTVVKREVAGDAFFPVFEDRFDLVATLSDTPEFTVYHYVNRHLAAAGTVRAPAVRP
jgi:dihydrofolate reductase